jgi:uncharacterized protein (TIGR00661 family)
MKILYGLAGEGFGHSSRALTIIPFLQKHGHEIKVITYGQAYQVLKDKFDVFKISGSHIEFTRGKIDYTKTFNKNLERTKNNLRNYKKIHSLVKSFQPDLCITDMEPITPIISSLYKLPLISIDNQHRITNLKLTIPQKYYKDYLLAKTVVNIFARYADFYVVTSFTPTKIIKKNTTIVPPIIREEVKKVNTHYSDKILVYLTKKNGKVLKEISKINEQFVVYGLDKKQKSENLEFKTKETFLEDLANCKAIIATAGFTLMSEALYLKKPYLALPLHGQFEQTLNALFLKQAGFGDYSQTLKKQEIENFLNNLDKYKTKLRSYHPNYNLVFKSILNAINGTKSINKKLKTSLSF